MAEFNSIAKAYNERIESEARRDWEIARTTAAVSLLPYSKKGIDPKRLIPLWYDTVTPKEREERPKLTKEEITERMEMMRKKYEH